VNRVFQSVQYRGYDVTADGNRILAIKAALRSTSDAAGANLVVT
jgi:hypothetical protein